MVFRICDRNFQDNIVGKEKINQVCSEGWLFFFMTAKLKRNRRFSLLFFLFSTEIDVVYTWVNGSDPKLLECNSFHHTINSIHF